MPVGSSKRRVAVRRIARETGYSESTVYKILANPIGFSKETVETVRRAAETYGVGAEGLPARAGEGGKGAVGTLRIGVLIPARPLYFWREAILGMEAGKARMERETGLSLRLQYTYYAYPFDESGCARALAFPDREPPDALILFPIAEEACRRFLESDAGAALPVILFNETQAYMTDAWFAAHPNVGYIGPDGYDEGVEAARLIRQCVPHAGRVAVVYSRHDHGANTSVDRVRGLCGSLGGGASPAELLHVELDPSESMAPATLARRLMPHYANGMVDCVYISSGMTHVASAAVEKIARRLGREISTFVIGHEVSAADKRYLLEGRQRGYIKQDVYTQGAEAVRDAVLAAQGEALPTRRLYRPSVFIR